MNILLIDDSATIRQVFKTTLVHMGHRVSEAENGNSGIAHVQQKLPDLIFLDVEMPGMSGFETAREIRRICDPQDIWIPIIFLSANMDDTQIERAHLAGGDDFLMKPVSQTLLATRLNTISHITRMRDQINRLSAELEQAHTRLTQPPATDKITGTANLAILNDKLEEHWRACARQEETLSLLMVQIDHFDAYSAENPQSVIDKSLKIIADLLIHHTCRSTHLVARTGNDQFAVLLPRTDLNGAIQQAEAIRGGIEALELAHPKSPTSPWVTVSLGIAVTVPEQPRSSYFIIEAANDALHDAREAGHNCALISPKSLS